MAGSASRSRLVGPLSLNNQTPLWGSQFVSCQEGVRSESECQLKLLLAKLQGLLMEASSLPPVPGSRQKCKSPAIRGCLLHIFLLRKWKILSSSSFICEPPGSLRGFKLINQSTDIELNLHLGLETLQSALNGKETKGPAALPPP